VWILQSRVLAHHGWNVLAVDLPGHCRSGGEAPASVEAGADFIAALLDAAGVAHAALIGHSWGSLIALEAASRLGARVSHLVLVGTAYPMKVSAALLDAALNEPLKALKMINVFSRSTLAPPPSVLGPGTWVYGVSMALGRRVLASNAAVNVFHRGFAACDSYAHGEEAMAAVSCPVLMLLGAQDQMTPPKSAQTLIASASASGKACRVIALPVGHHQMSEAPDPTLQAIRDFLQP
jgi:pimeloyl-ACP methyl ester carboxylesterase